MASNDNTTKMDLQCSACSDIYSEPYSVCCGHTVCLGCILKTEKDNKIKCPVCCLTCDLSDIQPDKKTKWYLDDYYNSTDSNTSGCSTRKVDLSNLSSVFSTPEKWCNLCHKKPSTCKCVTCDLLICSECKSSHINSFGNLDHNITSVERNVQDLRRALKKVIKTIAVEKQEMISRAKCVRKALEGFYFQEAEELLNLRKLQLLRTKELEDHHNRLESEMREHNRKAIRTLRTNEESIKGDIVMLSNKMEQFLEALKMNSTVILEETVGTVTRDIIPEMKKIKSRLEKKPKDISPAQVVTGKRWNPASSTVFLNEVNVAKGDSTDGARPGQIKPISSTNAQAEHIAKRPETYRSARPPRPNLGQNSGDPVNFSRLRGIFTPTKEASLVYTPQNVTAIGNKIYCAGCNPDGIYIYDKNVNLVKSIQSPKIRQPKAVAKVGGSDLIIACDDDFGLNQYSVLGIDKVASGSFSDVCSHVQEQCAKMYALEYKLYRILIFKCKGHAMVPIKKISLHYERFSQWDTLKVHSDGMYVSSFQNNQIYEYTDGGDLVKIGRSGSMAGQFIMPRLCEIDSMGSAVALDCDNKRIQVYRWNQRWIVLPLGTILRRPIGAAVDKSLEYIWVVDIGLKKLIAFIPEHHSRS